MITRYSDFINENLEILLESDVKYSEKFRKVLKKIGGSVSDALLDIENKDYPVQSNYFDITDANDAISFTPDRKVKELIDKSANKWRYAQQGRNIDPNEKYQYLWDGLGLNREERSSEPPVGTMGTIGKEFVSPASGKKFVVFIPDNTEIKPIGVNIEALKLGGEYGEQDFFRLSRQTIRVGRGIRAILNSAKIKVVDKDVEDFVNKYKATIDSINDVFFHFENVTGGDIAHWYHHDNYEQGTSKGTLGSSCMAGAPDEWLEIYTGNPDKVSLAIYKCPEDSSKIRGRALVWKLNNGKTFMDRIYTHNDSDIELFRQYAKKNGWNYKYYNGSSSDGSSVNPNGDKENFQLEVTLSKSRYDNYPYLDTLKYFNQSSKLLKNYRKDGDLELEDTDGGYCSCDTCGGNGRVDCEYCDGDGRRTCSECDGNGRVDCSVCDGEEVVECPECSGDGYKHDSSGNRIKDDEGNYIKCENCKGECSVTCPECDGRGRETCPECDGDGDYDCDECDDGRIDCPECG